MGRFATATAVLAGAGLLYYGYRAMTRPELKYFSASEFGTWWPMMNQDLLLKLDAFRELWAAPVSLSPAEGGLGRKDSSNSQHNVLKWGEVRAADIMPHGMDTAADRQRAVSVAKQVGFTGIGVYPSWKPRPGIHVDVREPEYAGHVAQWSQLASGGPYLSITEGLA